LDILVFEQLLAIGRRRADALDDVRLIGLLEQMGERVELGGDGTQR